MILFFTVDKQIITRRDNEKVVRDSQNYLYINFSFSEDWTGTKTAVFKGKSGNAFNVLIDENGSCLVPWEVLTEEYFEVSAFCGDLITANVVKVFTIQSGYEIGSQGRIPTPDIYAQIIARLSAIEAEIDPTAIQQIVDEYLSDKDYVTEADVEQIVSDYVEAHKDELKGDTGATPSISATATVSNTTGTPAVDVTKSGTDEEPVLNFAFSGIKGQDISAFNKTLEEWDALTDEQKNQYDYLFTPEEETRCITIPKGGTAEQALVKRSSEDYDAEWVDIKDIDISKEVDTVGVYSRIVGSEATATVQSDGSVNVTQSGISANTVCFKVPIDITKDNYLTTKVRNSNVVSQGRIMIFGVSPIYIVGGFNIYSTSEFEYTIRLTPEVLASLGLSDYVEIGFSVGGSSSAIGGYNVSWANKIGYNQDLAGLSKTIHDMSMSSIVGKKCIFLGDGITAQVGDVGWVDNFIFRTGAVRVVNVAVNNAQLNDYEDTVYDGDPKASVQHNNTLGNQVQKIINGQYSAPDLIIIAIGTNNGITADSTRLSDAYTNYPSLASLDKTHSEGAFRYCNETLHNLYPDAKIVWCNPIPRAYYQSNISDYADALGILTNWGSAYNIESNRCGIIAAEEVATHVCLRDGLHPNKKGAEKVAEFNAAAISKLFI